MEILRDIDKRNAKSYFTTSYEPFFDNFLVLFIHLVVKDDKLLFILVWNVIRRR